MTSHLSAKKWSVLLIGMILSVFVAVLILWLAERIQRFAKNSSGIEASTQAYYKANSTIEQQLMATTELRTQPWTLSGTKAGNPSSGSGYELVVSTGSSEIPEKWKWNSPFSSGYNLITLSEPIQLVIPEGIDWNNVNIEFRVPDLDSDWTLGNESLSVPNTQSWVILWTLGSSEDILYASGETNIVQYQNINDGTPNYTAFNIWAKKWFRSSDTTIGDDFWTFYTSTLWINGNACSWYKCTLKFSMIRRVPLTQDRILPFLEYKITFNKDLPNRYMFLDSKAYVRGYLRSRSVQIPQITTNTALDFAVLQ